MVVLFLLLSLVYCNFYYVVTGRVSVLFLWFLYLLPCLSVCVCVLLYLTVFVSICFVVRCIGVFECFVLSLSLVVDLFLYAVLLWVVVVVVVCDDRVVVRIVLLC